MKWFIGLILVLCMVGLACPVHASNSTLDFSFETIAGPEFNSTANIAIDKEITAPAEVPIDGLYVGIFRPFAGSCANGACSAGNSGPSRPVVAAARGGGATVARAARWVVRPLANARNRRLNRRS